MASVIESSFANISVLDLTKEELQQEYQSLKKLHEESVQDIEQKNQQIYDFRRQLATAAALEREYQQEIEASQTASKDECKKLSETIQNLEKENKTLIGFSEQVHALEEDLNDKNGEIERLQTDLKLMSGNTSLIGNSKDNEALSNENTNLKSDLLEVTLQFEEIQVILEEKQKVNNQLEEALSHIKNEYNQLEENYNIKKEEAAEKSDVIENLQDEIIVMKNELDMLKSKPLDEASRGNSLFAEVDDRRVQLMKEMTFMQTKFKEMKREKAENLKEITQLRMENAKLLQKYKNDIVERQEDDQMLLKSHDHRITTLQHLVENYQKQIKDNPFTYTGSNFTGEELRFVQGMLDKKSAENEELLQEMNRYSLTDMMLTSQLRNCNAELRNWKSLAMEHKLEIGELKNSIKLMKMEDDKVSESTNQVAEKPVAALKRPKPLTLPEMLAMNRISKNVPSESIKKNVEAVEKAPVTQLQLEVEEQNDKENVEKTNIESQAKPSRKVTFSEDTQEDRDSKITKRKGAKILTYKTLFIPSIPKD